MIDLTMGRRDFMHRAGTVGAALIGGTSPAFAKDINLGLPSAPSTRPLTRDFPQKGEMILQRARPPLLETPFSVFDEGVFTPNDRFFVRWHLASIPPKVEVETFKLTVRGHVEKALSLSLDDLMKMPRVEMAAVNQCSGNSRGFFAPRVPGGEWGNGAMGNAKWTGVRLKDVLDKAGVKPGAVDVRFDGLDQGLVPQTPDFRKSLSVDHARDGEVMIAFAMNGAPLPLLNGFPLRLIVPGWYSTYWVKALDRLEVLAAPDAGYWMEKAYRIPTAPHANVPPGTKDFPSAPINRMVPRAFFTNRSDGARVQAGAPFFVRGIAMGGAAALMRVDLSMDGGKSWHAATLGADHGKYGFRLWEATLPGLRRGGYRLWVRAANRAGEVQAMAPNWNPGGFMRNAIESVAVHAA